MAEERWVKVEPDPAYDLSVLSRRFKELGNGKELKKKFTAAMRSEANQSVVQTKAAARALPSKHEGRSRGFRAATARATSVQIKTAADARVSVRISRRGAMAKYGDLPRIMNRKSTFIHPVFGKGQAAQHGSPGWFDNVQKAIAPEMQAKLYGVMKDYERMIMRDVRPGRV